MYIFVGNLAVDVREADLLRMFGKYVDSASRVELAPYHTGGESMRCGLIRVRPNRRARAVIDRLGRRVFRGRRLVVREFVHRSCSNERRALSWRQRPWVGAERRQGERRVSALLASNGSSCEPWE